MKIKKDDVTKFKDAFQNDTGAKLTIEQAAIGLENLSRFFELLWKFDQEDKQKEKEMEINKNGN